MTTPPLESLTALFTAVEQLKTAGQTEAALARYRQWLAQVAASPLAYAVWFNLGVELAALKRPTEAIAAYRQALEIKDDFVPAQFNLGTQLEQLGQPAAALAQWHAILDNYQVALADDLALHTLVLNNLGRLLEIERDYPAAEAMLARSLILDAAQPKALQHWLHLRQKQCAWPLCAELGSVTPEQMIAAASALSTLALTDDPAQQLAIALRFVAERVAPAPPPLATADGYGHRKLRIGYLSSDFCLHPVALLTVQLFELHDRERFAVHGFCWTREDGSALRRRIIAAMDQFTVIGELDDAAAARCIREQEIDILIDLQGLTSGARPHVLMQRPAPVQISYLGFPGTSGLPTLDYLLADAFLIPDGERQHYSEQPLLMPQCFQVSDCRRDQAPPLTRAAVGLPEDGFVFCCFNNNYKITEEVFGAWMRILQQVPGSVLWLLADNPSVPLNLRREAQQRGIDPQRLVFAERVAPAVYLTRYTLADVFLDTFPFNAGTTANDALWMGLPVLTRSGRAFAARMAGALLHAAALDALIVDTLAEYEALAVQLAQSPSRLLALKTAVAALREHSEIFDMPARVREIEALYVQAYVEKCPTAAFVQKEIEDNAATIPCVLQLGGEQAASSEMVPIFQREQWRHLRYDCDPTTQPDILGEFNDLRAVPTGAMDAVLLNHTLERLFAHDAARALAEARRVLKPAGFVVVICADLQAACAKIAANETTQPLWQSNSSLTPIDLIFGHQAAIAAGHTQLAHRCGFTRDSLAAALTAANFGRVGVIARPEYGDLWGFASVQPLLAADFAELSQRVFIQ